MTTIPLTQGYVALVDACEYERAIIGPKWFAKVVRRKDGTVRNIYAIRHVYRNGKKTTERLHRFLLGITDDPAIQVDHAPDHSGLNNRRSNLRICTNAQNQHNRRLDVNSTSGVKGVSWDKRAGKFRASIMAGGRSKNLGCYASKYDAGRSYDVASKKYHGSYGLTNEMMNLYPKPMHITIQLQLELLA